MKTIPLKSFSVLQNVSVIEMLGLRLPWPRGRFSLQLNLNLHTPLAFDPRAYLIIDAKDEHAPPTSSDCCFSLSNLKRWRLDLSSYKSFDDYMKAAARWHRCTYTKAKKAFLNYGCETSFIEGDWSEHAETVARLYGKVARNYQYRLFDLEYFKEIAKDPGSTLLCAWFKNEMIGVIVLQDELPTWHNICCGLDYHHSSPSCTYSWMHYVLLELAIARNYHVVDVGFTADDAKKSIGFQQISSRMDLYLRGRVGRTLLGAFSRYCSASLSAEGKVQFSRPKRLT